MKSLFILPIIALLFLVACSSLNSTCGENYFEYKKGDCCSDLNKNKICDSDESEDIIKQVQEKAARNEDLENLKKNLQNTDDNKSVYEIVEESLSGKCWFYMEEQIFGPKTITPGEENTQDPKKLDWFYYWNIKCSTKKDCTTYLENLGMTSTDFEETFGTEDNIKCSENKPQLQNK